MVDGDLDVYIECLQRIAGAIEKLQEIKSASGDASIIGLVSMIFTNYIERITEKGLSEFR